jgi:antitoxin HicB
VASTIFAAHSKGQPTFLNLDQPYPTHIFTALIWGSDRPKFGQPEETYKVPLVLTRQPEGGYTVTSPLLPELVTEGDTLDEALMHVQDAVQTVVELYEDLGKPLPASLRQSPEADAIQFEYAVAVP